MCQSKKMRGYFLRVKRESKWKEKILLSGEHSLRGNELGNTEGSGQGDVVYGLPSEEQVEEEAEPGLTTGLFEPRSVQTEEVQEEEETRVAGD